MALTKITNSAIADDIGLGGNPTTSTQTAGDSTTRIATTAFVSTAVANLVDSAPDTLNTLAELATSIGNSTTLSSTLTSSIATKLPLAGGTLTGNLNLGDNVRARFGLDSDLQIYHDGTHSYINSSTGSLYARTGNTFQIENQSGSEDLATFAVNGAVTLYHNNAAKIATTATGIDVTGNVDIPDNGKLLLGASDDLEIYHDGSNSYIADRGTGNLRLEGTNIALNNQASNKTYLLATDGGSVQLRHNDLTKIETTTTGIDVTGNIGVSGTVDGIDIAARDAVLTSTTTTAGAALPKAGGTMTGNIQLNNNIELRTLDTGGNARTIVRANSSNELEFGWSVNAPVKFMGGGSYTERMRIHTNGNIAINHTSAPHTLTVKGTISRLNSSGIQVTNLQTNNDNGQIAILNSGGVQKVLIDSNGGSTFNGGAVYFTGGNVGIGTTTPNAKLTVRNSTTATDTIVASAGLAVAGNYHNLLLADGANYAVGLRRHITVSNPSYLNPRLDFFVQNTSTYLPADRGVKMTILGSGNVGIGTTSPESLLTIQNDDAGIRLRSNTTTAKGLTLRYNHAGNFGQLLVDHQGNNQLAMKYYALSHSFGRSDSDVNVIMDDSGRLLVGSTTTDASTSERFLVKSTGGEHSRFVNSSDTYTTVYIKNTSTTANTNQPFLTFQDTGGNRGNLGLRYSTAQLVIQGHGGVGIAGGSGFNQDPDLFVNTSGNVGIGTASPTASLTIHGADQTQGSVRIVPHTNKGDEVSHIHYGTAGDWYIRAASTSGKVIINDNGGNVGIGTRSPSYKFDVYGTDDITMRIHRPSSGLALTDTCGIGFSHRGDTNTSTSDTRAAIVSTYNGSLYLCTEPGGNLNSNPVDHAALSIVGTTQNVGIGTTSPSSKFHVHSTADTQIRISADNSMALHQDAAWNSNMYFGAYHDGTNVVYGTSGRSAFRMVNLHDGDSSPQYIAFYGSNAGVAGNTISWNPVSLAMDEDGNVGIGTTNPDRQLEISTTTAGLLTSSANRQGSVIKLTHNINHESGYTGGDFLGGIEFESGDGSAGGGVRAAIRAEATDPYNTHSLKFYTAASNSTSIASRMTIDHNGNVGIGTDTPQKKFHVEHTAGASEGILISGASDTAGHTAGILLRAEGGEADSALRAKAGIFLERTATYGIGKLHIANRHNSDNVSATISDANITIYDDKVGIGTTNPIAPLHVAGNAVIETGSPDLYFATTSASHTNWRVAAQEVVDAGFEIASGTQSAGSNAVNDTYTTRFAIKNTGNVGIGTITPEKNLSIGSSQAEGIQFNFDTTNNYRNQILNYWNSSADSRMDFNVARASGATPSTIMSVGYNSNVGIGTTSPTSKLEVIVTQSDTMTDDTAAFAIKGNGGDGILMGQRATTPYAAWIAAGYLPNIGTSHNYPLTLQPHGGNVGIGTTAPNAPLTVWTASSASSQSALRLNNPGGFSSSGAGCEIIFSQDRTTSEDLKMAAITSSQVSAGSSAHGALKFWTRASSSITEKVRIQHNGIISASAGIALGDGLGYTTANTLDDYEEGTFDLGVQAAGTVGSSSKGRYTKIGNQVTVFCQVDTGTDHSNSNVLHITGLPFTSISPHTTGHAGNGAVSYTAGMGGNVISAVAESGTTKVFFSLLNSGTLTHADCTATWAVRFTITYNVA